MEAPDSIICCLVKIVLFIPLELYSEVFGVFVIVVHGMPLLLFHLQSSKAKVFKEKNYLPKIIREFTLIQEKIMTTLWKFLINPVLLPQII